ncbi:MAG: putative drug exporter of the superfamily, partial [Mycobacterium sp.]|nr:putative drug exporter of the superfamily [Mycobacterium sp.]
MSRGAVATEVGAKGLFGRVGVFVLRWPWIVIGFWVALAAVLSVTFPPLTEMASKRPVPVLPSDAPVLVTTRQISEAFHHSGSENDNVLLVVLTDE